MFKRYAAITSAFFITFSVLLLIDRGNTFAETVAVHDHQHHDHVMKAPEAVVDLETRPAELKTGLAATILLSVKDTDGKPIQDLTITHERFVHVMIISADFSVFAHIHPEDFGPITAEIKKTAQFSVRYTFPKGGRYIIAVDSAVKDVPFSEQFRLDVTGAPEMGGPEKDFSREKKFGDYRVSLSLADKKISAGKETVLAYTVRMGGEPVKDLEPYLSAPMHLAIISSDLNNFIHAHGEVPGEPSAGHHDHAHMSAPSAFGPDIAARIIFPIKGVYQIFSEIKHHGKVIPLSFMVEAE